MKPRMTNLIWGIFFMVLGLGFAGSAFGIWNFGRLIFPLILITIGIGIICSDSIKKNWAHGNFDNIQSNMKEGQKNYSAVFCGQTVYCDNQVFEGANIDAAFGSLKLKLEQAIIHHDVTINCNAVFGSVEIYLPSDVNVRVSGTPVFGGINNRSRNMTIENAPVVYINATAMFGGVEIR